MSALGFVAGGLLEGAGAGILAEAKAQRDFMLKGIDQEFQGEQARLGREHQTELQSQSEAAADRRQASQIEATHEEGEAGRKLTASEGELTRKQQTAIQKQNEEFLASLPSNNPETTDDTTGLKYTRSSNGLLNPMNGPDGQQMSQLRLRVSDKGRLAAVDEPAREGETLSAPLPYAAAVEQSRGILGDVRTDKLIAGRSDVAKTGADAKTAAAEAAAGAKKDAAQINADARMHIASASDETKRLMIQTISDDKAKARDALEKLKQMGIDAETANVAARGMSAAEVARINAGSREKAAEIGAASREPGAAQRIKGDQTQMEAVNSQAQRLARAAGDQVYKAGGTFQGEGTIFKDFGGRKQFESDFADEMAEDLVKKRAGEIKMTRTPDQIIADLRAARGGAPAEGGAGAGSAPGKPAPKLAKSASGVGKSRDNPATPQSKEDLDALESGDYYTNPSDGALYQKK